MAWQNAGQIQNCCCITGSFTASIDEQLDTITSLILFMLTMLPSACLISSRQFSINGTLRLGWKGSYSIYHNTMWLYKLHKTSTNFGDGRHRCQCPVYILHILGTCSPSPGIDAPVTSTPTCILLPHFLNALDRFHHFAVWIGRRDVWIQAARDGLLEAVRLNLDDSRTQLNDIDEEGYTALHYAARYNRLEVVEVLVKAGTGLSVALVRPPPVHQRHRMCRYIVNVRLPHSRIVSKRLTTLSSFFIGW